ncbi:M1 family metallopeptidase [Actinocrispum wychmicini]|uniref:Peptidase M1-like protein n=1 Tax=Actinocrispum wychmicini TaxID=1213861 RepID=A0A4R2J930_9PSEU|nr:M1 family metallopeptidase [Actinocrispum wychmicini]TCO55833.1 peptidase M1-like protein [Actinocrispum wychmicini]
MNRRVVTAVAATTAWLTLSQAVAYAETALPGSDGAGDGYYPQDGNGGYDVGDYNLTITYDPATNKLDSTEVVTATATQPLSAFNLDLYRLKVSSIDVDGISAKFSRSGDHELTIDLPNTVDRGQTFKTTVKYSGEPTSISGPLGENGWHHLKSGAAYVAGEPQGSAAWYAVNDTPKDKATFHLTITVPAEWGVISNGKQKSSSRVDDGKNTKSVWAEETPIVPYMTTVAIDKFDFTYDTADDKTPIVNAYSPTASQAQKDAEAKLPEVLTFLTDKLGPYPVDAAGGIFHGTSLGFSLETMSRPVYADWADLETIVHENTHQWYGDAVAVTNWKDICLNECFASYLPWMWAEEKDGTNLDDKYRAAVTATDDDYWTNTDNKLYDMGPGHEFTWNGVYTKGPLALHALRRTIGDKSFTKILKDWPALHKNGDATFKDWQKYVELVTGKDLSGFFDAWFYGKSKPEDKYLYPGKLKPKTDKKKAA